MCAIAKFKSKIGDISMLVELLKYYSEKGVITDDQGSILCPPLYESCECRKDCWSGIEKMKTDWNKIQFPFIGDNYFNQDKKVLVVGLNLNEYGGYKALIHLSLNVQYAILNHWQKIRFGNIFEDYRGSVFWHRVALYSAIILNYFKLQELNQDMLTDFENLSQTMEKISFINAVKCSPKDDNSESSPTQIMKTNCPKTFLVKELLELNPDVLIIMGKDTLIMPEKFNQNYISSSKSGNIDSYKLNNGNKIISSYIITHPTARGGNNSDIPYEFKDFIGSSKI